MLYFIAGTATSLLGPIESFSLFGVSFELAIIRWTVQRIVSTPENYRVEYYEADSKEMTINFSNDVRLMVNMSTMRSEFVAILTNLRSGQPYTVRIAASDDNFVTSVYSDQSINFSLRNSGEFMVLLLVVCD